MTLTSTPVSCFECQRGNNENRLYIVGILMKDTAAAAAR